MIFKELTINDRHTDTTKLTQGIFTGGAGTLEGPAFSTASISSSNVAYFYTLQEGSGSTAVERLDVAWGHKYGSGSSATTYANASKAIYRQWANLILDSNSSQNQDPSFTFKSIFSGSEDVTVDNTPDSVYILSVKQDTTKDRLDQRWSIVLSGSRTNLGGAADHPTGSSLHLTNYTASLYEDQSTVGGYYKVISGSAGVPSSITNETTCYGHFYPELSAIVFDADRLSGSLNGDTAFVTEGGGAGHDHTGLGLNVGLAPDLSTDGTADNAGKLVHALTGTRSILGDASSASGSTGGSITMRSEEDINQTTYYCRMWHNEFNISSNPSFLESGSELGDIDTNFIGNPTVYATAIGLHNSDGDLIAVAKLSEPQKKNFNTELTVAAKIDG
tara:strand:- start:1184 stop:2350 length:1167 start_codon:yes stop_codon:yes gene_type:complete